MPLDVVRVDSVRQAAGILAAEKAARFLGGGTLLVRSVTEGAPGIARIVLSDGLDLDRIAIKGASVEAGACATMAAVAATPELAFLRPVAESVGGPAVRAMATIGGNLFAPPPYGDFAVALLALGATVVSETRDGAETQPVDAFLALRPADAIVTAVQFRIPAAGAFRFVKAIRRKPNGAAILSIAAVLPVADGKIAGARIAYGAMAGRPIRATAAERALEGRPLDAASIEAAVAVAAEGTDPPTDEIASAWYRRAVLPVHFRRLLSGKIR